MSELSFETKREEKVRIENHGPLLASSSVEGTQPDEQQQQQQHELPNDWPSGSALLAMMQSYHQLPSESASLAEEDAAYWQASARWALLSKFQKLPVDLQNRYITTTTTTSMDDEKRQRRRLVLSSEDVQAIDELWKNEQQSNQTTTSAIKTNNDLREFLSTSRSNSRPLQWAVMDCAPACQFRLHAHPNIELVYCIRGALHEIRMAGDPLSLRESIRPAATESEDSDNKNVVLTGPNLTNLERSWYFDTLRQGEWLVNEVGSIHKSFTATNGDGCVLLVLWGGSHADIPDDQVPRRVGVQEALDTMDRKLSSCSGCTQWDTLSETFLPASEKSSA